MTPMWRHGKEFTHNITSVIVYAAINLILAWISIHIHYKVRDENTYPFPNFNGSIVEAWEWISNFISHIIMEVISYQCWD